MKKKLFYWIILIICIHLFLISCIADKKPAITFEKEIYNFGELVEGKDITYTFTYKNSGTDILKITAVKPTCGCTIPGEYTYEVAPGKTGTIPMVFKSKGLQGDVSKTILIETNIPNSEPIFLSMEGIIKVLIEINPDNIWLGQTSKDGPPLTETINIKNNVDTPLEILKITSTGEGCTTKINTIKEGKEYSIDLKISPPFTMKQVKETLFIMTNIKDKEMIKIKYQYYGISEVEISPEEIIISMKYLNQDRRQILTVKSNKNSTIDIINPRILNGENIDLALEEVIPGKHIQLILYFTEKFEFPKDNNPTLTFKIKNEKGETVYTIPIKDADAL